MENKKLHIVDNNSLHYFEDDSFDKYQPDADLFSPSISVSVFLTQKEAFEYILKQAETRVVYHSQQEVVYRHLHNAVLAEVERIKDDDIDSDTNVSMRNKRAKVIFMRLADVDKKRYMSFVSPDWIYDDSSSLHINAINFLKSLDSDKVDILCNLLNTAINE